MKFPSDLTDWEASRYKEIFAAGDGERLLIDLGADLTQRNNSDQSLLEIAEERECEAVARTLRSLEIGRMLWDAMASDGDAPREGGRGFAL